MSIRKDMVQPPTYADLYDVIVAKADQAIQKDQPCKDLVERHVQALKKAQQIAGDLQARAQLVAREVWVEELKKLQEKELS